MTSEGSTNSLASGAQDAASYWYWQWVTSYYNYYLNCMWHSNYPGSQWGTQPITPSAPRNDGLQSQRPGDEDKKALEKRWLEFFQQQNRQWQQHVGPQTQQYDRQQGDQQPEVPTASQNTAEDVVRQARQSGLNVEYTFQRGYEVKPAPLTLRIMAAFIDFAIISVLQYCLFAYVLEIPMQLPLVFTLLLSDNTIEIADEEALFRDIENFTYYMAIYFTTVLLYESIFNAGGTNPLGGGTPGKKIMGLSVMRCETAHVMANGNIAVFPGGGLGSTRSSIRAVFKNLSQSLFLPMFITIFVTRTHRAAYDVMSGSIVVLQPPNVMVPVQQRRGP